MVSNEGNSAKSVTYHSSYVELRLKGETLMRKKIHSRLSVQIVADRLRNNSILVQSLFANGKKISYFEELGSHIKKSFLVSDTHVDVVAGVLRPGLVPMYRAFLRESNSNGVFLVESFGKQSRKARIYQAANKCWLLRAQRAYDRK